MIYAQTERHVARQLNPLTFEQASVNIIVGLTANFPHGFNVLLFYERLLHLWTRPCVRITNARTRTHLIKVEWRSLVCIKPDCVTCWFAQLITWRARYQR